MFGAVVLFLIAYHARMGAVSPRIANPEAISDARPVEFLFGWGDLWLAIHEWGTVVVMLLIIAACVRAWRRQPGHPYVLMTIASTAIVWQDPIMNWAPYAVYNPELWHWPEDWPLIELSPTVEPFIVIGYAAFYFGPFFPAMALLRRLQARASMDAFVWRHPLWSLAGLTFVIGFIFDACLEIMLVHTGLYIYSQVIPWGSLFAGTTFQFPLIWESSLVCVVMVPAAVLCYRDDTGRTQAEKLVQRFRFLTHRPALGTFLMMFAILNAGYFVYGGAFATIRASGLATAVACPYPYRDAKVYDPQGYYETEGEPGPFFEGYWNGWMTAQPEGRPQHNPVRTDGMCKGEER
ncbi:MAG: spirocyclase AveC family protein [Myxococcales bacterium]|nr:spirocyclase AveC family protein [Myxococcales bacterium]